MTRAPHRIGTSKRESWIKGSKTPGPGAYNNGVQANWIYSKPAGGSQTSSVKGSSGRLSPGLNVQQRIKTIRVINPIVGKYSGAHGLTKNSFSAGKIMRNMPISGEKIKNQ